MVCSIVALLIAMAFGRDSEIGGVYRHVTLGGWALGRRTVVLLRPPPLGR